MKIRFKKKTYIWLMISIILIIFVGCGISTNSKSSGNEVEKLDERKNISAIDEMNIDKLLEFKDSYVGDNSAVGNIIYNLPGNDYFGGMTLQTNETPYEISMDYGVNDKLGEENFREYWTEEQFKKLVLNNTTTLFILVKNVDEISFVLNGGEKKQFFTVSRKELESFYGRELREYAEDILLWEKEIFENTLKSDEKIDSFYKIHNAEKLNEVVSKEDNKELKAIELYFADDNAEYLVPEVRKFKNQTLKSVLEELIKGPTEPNLYKTLPENLEVIEVEIKERIAYVNLSEKVEENMEGRYGTSTGAGFFLYSIVNTLTLNDEFEIDKVKLLIEGEEKELLGPLYIKEPFGPNIDWVKNTETD